MSAQDLPTLRAGPLEVALAPAVGGCIAGFDHVTSAGRRKVLRGARHVPAHILDAASFPLVPYVNRIRGGAFTFRGREVRLAPNMPPDPSPLHGQGWLAAWDVASVSETSAKLHFRHPAGAWPWDYEATQHFILDRAGLEVRLSCTNRSGEPMPCGLGHHPYFPCTAETRLDTKVRWAWTIDDRVLPLERVPAEGRYDLRRRAVCSQDLDHGFGGWSGRARIESPEMPFAIVMSSPSARFFQLYSPASGGLIVAEPVSHANAALNAAETEWPELGLEVLDPGQTMDLTMRIDIVPSA